MDLGGRCEFHTHTFFSDGFLSPIELIRRAYVLGDDVVALTDHVDCTNIEHVLGCQLKLGDRDFWGVKVLVGVELTHTPVKDICEMVDTARGLGAQIVVGHGETPCEPVEEGSNRAYIEGGVDVLAHPGNLSVEDTQLAADAGVFLELTSREGHREGNPFVAGAALEAGADLVVDTDAHRPEDLITQGQALQVALDAGLCEEDAVRVVRDNPKKLLEKLF